MLHLLNGLVKIVELSMAFTACLKRVLFHVFISSFELAVSCAFLLSTPFESAIGIVGSTAVACADGSALGGVSDMIAKMQFTNGRLMHVGVLPCLSIEPNPDNNLFLKRLHQC